MGKRNQTRKSRQAQQTFDATGLGPGIPPDPLAPNEGMTPTPDLPPLGTEASPNGLPGPNPAKVSPATKFSPPASELAAPPVRKQIDQLVRQSPQYRIPGQGSGESFNAFRGKALPAVRSAMQELADDPKRKITIQTHPQVNRLVKAWVANGAPDSFSIDHDAFLNEKPAAPGAVDRLHPQPGGKWAVNSMPLEAPGELPGASIYLVPHGAGAVDGASAGQEALSLVAKHVRAGDFSRAHGVASRALAAGHASDADLEDAVQSNLPSPEEAANLPSHHLLGVVSAADPERRKQYAQVMQDRFSDLSGVSPEARQILGSHLKKLGMES